MVTNQRAYPRLRICPPSLLPVSRGPGDGGVGALVSVWLMTPPFVYKVNKTANITPDNIDDAVNNEAMDIKFPR